MNIYGDTGNIIALQHRGKIREININVKAISSKDNLNANEVDIYFFGGGQDNQQVFVSQDIQKYKSLIQEEIRNGAVALTICGGYQLFGKFYRPFDGNDLKGLEIFPLETFASHTRMINNLIIEQDVGLKKQIEDIYTDDWAIPDTLVGFENHSGQTRLAEGTKTLGRVIYGYGNNDSKQFEGCRVYNAFGTYMHGSLLPKNPHFTDYLLALALEYKYKEKIKFKPIHSDYALKAHAQIVSNYR